MYSKILKKDLKRKKTMNIIVLVFVVLAAMFISSSMNNIIAVFGGVEGYFDKSGMGDYVAVAIDNGDPTENNAALDGISEIKGYTSEPLITVNDSHVDVFDEKTSGYVFPINAAQLKYYNPDNSQLTDIKDGEAYICAKSSNADKYEAGSKMTITMGGEKFEFTIAGKFKDPMFGAALAGGTRIALSQSDFEKISNANNDKTSCLSIYYIDTDDVAAVEKQTREIPTAFTAGRSTLKLLYLVDMVVAVIMLVVSILLIITAFIVLRFTISFTLSEDFREIGVMKAIGIKNIGIRTLYIVKYFALAVVGAAVGFVAGIPFGKMMLDSVTKIIVLESENSLLVNLISSLAVVLVIVLFCYTCTRKISKATPMDAIRSGQTGERYRKKSLVRLSRSKLGTTSFLAVNDVLSSPKKYGLISVIIALLLIPVLMIANTANTMKSDQLIQCLGLKEADVYTSYKSYELITEGTYESVNEELDNIEKKLADRGVDAHASIELANSFNYIHGDKSFRSNSSLALRADINDFKFLEGTAPANGNEIGMTKMVAEKIDAHIGDTVTVQIGGEDREFMVTALYQTMNNMGEGVRFHQDADIDLKNFMYFIIPFDFNDEPEKEELDRRVEIIKEVTGESTLSAAEYFEEMTGVGSSLDDILYLVLALGAIVASLVAILMERSFIEKERGEISLRKALGFKSGSIIRQHLGRMTVAAFIGIVIAVGLSFPLTNLCISPIFGMLGVYEMSFTYNFLQLLLILPVVFLAVIMVFTLVSAQYTRKITTAEIRGIE